MQKRLRGKKINHMCCWIYRSKIFHLNLFLKEKIGFFDNIFSTKKYLLSVENYSYSSESQTPASQIFLAEIIDLECCCRTSREDGSLVLHLQALCEWAHSCHLLTAFHGKGRELLQQWQQCCLWGTIQVTADFSLHCFCKARAWAQAGCSRSWGWNPGPGWGWAEGWLWYSAIENSHVFKCLHLPFVWLEKCFWLGVFRQNLCYFTIIKRNLFRFSN